MVRPNSYYDRSEDNVEVNSGAELARALKDNDWTASKTTDKTIVIMSALANIPWDKVKLLNLNWTTVNGEIVPLLQMAMHEPMSAEALDKLKDEPDFDVEFPKPESD